MKLSINDRVMVKHKGFTWSGTIVNCQWHDNGNNYYVESRVNKYKGWYGRSQLKKIEDPNNLLKKIL